MQRIDVRCLSGQHPILIAPGLSAHIGETLRHLGLRPGPAALVSSPAIARLYSQRIAASLQAAGFRVTHCAIPDDEPHKSLATVAVLYERFVADALCRQSPVVALGGGTITDIAGFAAATYLRGVPLVLLPTTLLAMVDAAIGGKTAVNLPQGKNLIGAFKPPDAVILDPTLLATLPEPDFRAGWSEVVKHGIIGAPDLFAALEQPVHLRPDLIDLIAAAVQVKVRIVQVDPLESGIRAHLNLGHTFAHAFERCSGYRLPHGEAVSVGLVAAARLAFYLQRCPEELPTRIATLLSRLGLPIGFRELPIEGVMAAMAHDKKRIGTKLRLVIPLAIGQVALIEDCPADAIRRALLDVLTSDANRL